MAAGISSRFVPLSYELPKALIPVRGEILIERQIRQLREAGIDEIIVVVGYRHEQFEYLEKRLGVTLVYNPEYALRNNNASLYYAAEYLKNTYVCSADNYFLESPFKAAVEDSYYAAVYSAGPTDEWCLTVSDEDLITHVTIGGQNSWYMLGHTFWTADFSQRFLNILNRIYDDEDTKDLLWEGIFMQNLDLLPMKIKRYPQDMIFEFDSLDELRIFDASYQEKSSSNILSSIAEQIACSEGSLHTLLPLKDATGIVTGFTFDSPKGQFEYDYAQARLMEYQR